MVELEALVELTWNDPVVTSVIDEVVENKLGMCWHDSAWINILNQGNIMDYFAERSNMFYDRQCNNEIIKMQRLNPDQLKNMTGLEYVLLHVQEPILYVIRKQHRHSPTQAKSFSRYHPSKGYWWEFKGRDPSEKNKTKDKKKEEPSSLFQRQRVDMLLAELAKKFPPKVPAPPAEPKPDEQVKVEPKDIKQEKEDKSTRPPPEKKQKLSR